MSDRAEMPSIEKEGDLEAWRIKFVLYLFSPCLYHSYLATVYMALSWADANLTDHYIFEANICLQPGAPV